MAKFYVQSGNFQTTISAGDAEKAALWALHRVITQVMPFHGGEPIEGQQRKSKTHAEIMVLGETVLISEEGFESPNQIALDTFELQVHWHQLTIALARLESLMPCDLASDSECESLSATA